LYWISEESSDRITNGLLVLESRHVDDIVTVVINLRKRIVDDIAVEIQRLRIIELRVRYRLFLRAPIGDMKRPIEEL